MSRGIIRGCVALLLFCTGCQWNADLFRDRMDTGSPAPTIGSNADLKRNKTRFDLLRAKWNDDDPPATKIANRDAILEAGRSLINSYFVDYERELRRGSVTVDLGLGLTNLALTTASTLAGGDQTKTALSALATLTGGTQAAVDEAVYFKQTSSALIAKMQSLRARKLTQILRHHQSAAAQPTPAQNYARYTIADVDEDLLELYEAGTISGAVAAISNDARLAQETEAEAQNHLREISIDSPSTRP
jgi:hypothetical protein